MVQLGRKRTGSFQKLSTPEQTFLAAIAHVRDAPMPADRYSAADTENRTLATAPDRPIEWS